MKPRNAQTLRETKETRVYIQVRLDGPLGTKIKTGLPFFDHMLDSLAVHGRLGLDVDASGDVKVDPHHMIEDCGIVLGTVIAQAMVDVKGVRRAGYFGFPMDGSLALAAVDLCGRPNLVWNAEFGTEPVGGIPPRLFRGFFKGVADGLRATMHVNVPYRDDDHHAVEAVFKAIGRALREALTPTGDDTVPSTKGII
jgi:imidazoleglycerol phosphate dehydratase HisB